MYLSCPIQWRRHPKHHSVLCLSNLRMTSQESRAPRHHLCCHQRTKVASLESRHKRLLVLYLDRLRSLQSLLRLALGCLGSLPRLAHPAVLSLPRYLQNQMRVKVDCSARLQQHQLGLYLVSPRQPRRRLEHHSHQPSLQPSRCRQVLRLRPLRLCRPRLQRSLRPLRLCQ